jgi:hypothetical protein
MAKTQKDRTSKSDFKFIARIVKKLILQKRRKQQYKKPRNPEQDTQPI